MRSKYSEVSASDTFTVRQMPLKTTASHGRCSRASANAPPYALTQHVAPSRSTKTDGSLADSPALIWVTQLFTWVARSIVFACSDVPLVAMIVKMTTVSVPASAPSSVARRVRIRPFPTTVPSSAPAIAMYVNCAFRSTHPACASDAG